MVDEDAVAMATAHVDHVERQLRDTLSLLHDLASRVERLERAVRLVSSLHEVQDRLDRLERALRLLTRAVLHDAESGQKPEVKRLGRLASEALGRPSGEMARLLGEVERLVEEAGALPGRQRPPDQGSAA